MPKIKFGDIDFSGNGAYVWGEGQFSAPTRSVDIEKVQGRNGDIILDNGNYENITATYSVAIMGDVKENTDRLKYMLYSQRGYQRLYDSERKGFYRMATFYDGFKVDKNDASIVEIEFDCKPYLYDINGELVTTVYFGDPVVLRNKYFEPSRPLFVLESGGYLGKCKIVVNDKELIVDGGAFDSFGTLVIDTELQTAYNSLGNRNNYVKGTDLVLDAGENEISLVSFSDTEGPSFVEVKPRWVTI